MKKLTVLFLNLIIYASIFAQITYNNLGDCPGSCVVYQENTGNMINIVNVKDNYIIRYRDTSKNTAYSCKVNIEKSFNTKITYIESIEGTKEDFEKILLPIMQDLFFYTDMNMRNNLPGSFIATKKDLLSGKIMRSGLVDFYIPITNLVYEKDENDIIIKKCIQFGMISPNEMKYFLNSATIPAPVIRQMDKIKLQETKKVEFNNFNLELPTNWVLDNGYYILPNTTKRDAILYTEKISIDEMKLSDFYAYIMIDLLNVNAIVVPDSLKIEKLGEAICVTYNVMDYQYLELNTCKLCMFSEDGRNFDILRINGYSQFIDLNIDMINRIIEKGEVR
jgi:hypothetical protein